MERLTERLNDELGGILVKNHDYIEAAQKLAEYEDIGLTPDEIKDLITILNENAERCEEGDDAALEVVRNLIELAQYRKSGITPGEIQLRLQGWTPVKERLPEDGQIVLVTDRWCRELYIARHIAEGWVSEFNGHLFMHEPRAWIPLPEPYKEDSNGELPRQTNADRLRVMTDDELAAELCYRGVGDTVEEVKQWLQEPSND